MIKVLKLKSKDSFKYKANGEYETTVELDEEYVVTYSKKGNLILYKNYKFAWVTIERKEINILLL